MTLDAKLNAIEMFICSGVILTAMLAIGNR